MNSPQKLSFEAVEAFKAIYLDEFGENLSDDRAHDKAIRLLRFFSILKQDQRAL